MPTIERNERALEEGLRRCAREAFEEIYKLHATAVLDQLQRGLGYRSGAGRGIVRITSAFEAEELCQETFAIFFQLCREGRYDATRPARPFLLRIAANLALRRRHTGQREIPSDLEELEVEPTTTPDPEADERRRQLAAFLASCGEDERALVSLYFDEERSQHEIASTLGWSRDQVYRGLVRLRKSAERFFAERRWSREP
ncbi:sigma-70 family RNA polymerase sigma factor [Myxococcota bacterium]|nr:sigma-70 family RNA polymerase sigma factor [Myxococcota bacterium]